ncbi:MAG: MoxR family ATPase [Spirochaetaceae bacterium]|nr:MAG: MoxR family ATPase [Spirochaetaceae bacterium]
MADIARWAQTIKGSIGKVIYGKDEVVEKLLVALLCRGHVLLEDVPGVGKTILARAISASLGGEMQRVQCTPDLLPADVIGVSIYNQQTGEFEFRQGPVITNLLLVDEINRATPRTQSALLEAMEERTVTVDGNTMQLPRPFFMLATENPVEFEGTFPLPEAQKDRFFLSTRMGYPVVEAEKEIMDSQRRMTHPVADLEAITTSEEIVALQAKVNSVEVAPELRQYILDLVEATRNDARLKLGASPRASMALYKGSQALAALRGRSSVDVDDIRELVPPVLWKRISVRSEHLLKGLTEEKVIDEILERTTLPEEKVEA